MDRERNVWASSSKVRNIVTKLAPSWDVHSVEPVERGMNTTFRIDVETSETDEFYIFKTSKRSPERIMSEYRLHHLIADHTSIPIPNVYFGVDEHPDFPAPFFIQEGVHGEHLQHYPRKPPIETEQLIARILGRYIGQLQEVNVFSKFGKIRKVDSKRSDINNQSEDDHYGLGIEEGYPTWPPRLREAAMNLIDSVSQTQFGDLTPELRQTINSEIDGMDGDFSTVIGRIDHYYGNIIVNEDHDSIRSLIDWGLPMTVEPAYDIACAEVAMCGPIGLQDERRRKIRRELKYGYETVRSQSVNWSRRRWWLYLLVQHLARLLWDPLEVVVSKGETMEEKCRKHTEDLLTAIVKSSSHDI